VSLFYQKNYLVGRFGRNASYFLSGSSIRWRSIGYLPTQKSWKMRWITRPRRLRRGSIRASRARRAGRSQRSLRAVVVRRSRPLPPGFRGPNAAPRVTRVRYQRLRGSSRVAGRSSNDPAFERFDPRRLARRRPERYRADIRGSMQPSPLRDPAERRRLVAHDDPAFACSAEPRTRRSHPPLARGSRR